MFVHIGNIDIATILTIVTFVDIVTIVVILTLITFVTNMTIVIIWTIVIIVTNITKVNIVTIGIIDYCAYYHYCIDYLPLPCGQHIAIFNFEETWKNAKIQVFMQILSRVS